MLKLHVKTTYPEGATHIQSVPGFDVFIEPLLTLSAPYLVEEPIIETTSTTHLRIDFVETMESLKELSIARNQWILDNRVAEYRADVGATKELKIENADTNSILLDWVPMPDMPQVDFIAWANETFV